MQVEFRGGSGGPMATARFTTPWSRLEDATMTPPERDERRSARFDVAPLQLTSSAPQGSTSEEPGVARRYDAIGRAPEKNLTRLSSRRRFASPTGSSGSSRARDEREFPAFHDAFVVAGSRSSRGSSFSRFANVGERSGVFGASLFPAPSTFDGSDAFSESSEIARRFKSSSPDRRSSSFDGADAFSESPEVAWRRKSSTPERRSSSFDGSDAFSESSEVVRRRKSSTPERRSSSFDGADAFSESPEVVRRFTSASSGRGASGSFGGVCVSSLEGSPGRRRIGDSGSFSESSRGVRGRVGATGRQERFFSERGAFVDSSSPDRGLGRGLLGSSSPVAWFDLVESSRVPAGRFSGLVGGAPVASSFSWNAGSGRGSSTDFSLGTSGVCRERLPFPGLEGLGCRAGSVARGSESGEGRVVVGRGGGWACSPERVDVSRDGSVLSFPDAPDTGELSRIEKLLHETRDALVALAGEVVGDMTLDVEN